MEDWLADSNEALELRLGEHGLSVTACVNASLILPVRSPIDADVLRGDELVSQEPFSPAFTYPIFGEKETIFGYRGLDIKVRSGLWIDGQLIG
jgi:histone acetyltransferase 1